MQCTYAGPVFPALYAPSSSSSEAEATARQNPGTLRALRLSPAPVGRFCQAQQGMYGVASHSQPCLGPRWSRSPGSRIRAGYGGVLLVSLYPKLHPSSHVISCSITFPAVHAILVRLPRGRPDTHPRNQNSESSPSLPPSSLRDSDFAQPPACSSVFAPAFGARS